MSRQLRPSLLTELPEATICAILQQISAKILRGHFEGGVQSIEEALLVATQIGVLYHVLRINTTVTWR